MSVAPDDLMLLRPHRRPREHGGSGADPVWEIDEESLPQSLVFRLDSPEHGLIEPSVTMPLADYEEALRLASDCPHLDFGTIEIREIEQLG